MASFFIPSLRQIEEAAAKLPIPDLWPDDQYIIPIANSQVKQEVVFQKQAFRDEDEQLCYHWIYNGKVTVSTTPSPQYTN